MIVMAPTSTPRAVIDLIDGVRSITIPCPAGGEPTAVQIPDSITWGQLTRLIADHGWTVAGWRVPSDNRERLDALLAPAAASAA